MRAHPREPLLHHTPKSSSWTYSDKILTFIAICGFVSAVSLIITAVVVNLRSNTLEATLIQGQDIMTAFQKSGVIEAVAQAAARLVNEYLDEASEILATVSDLADSAKSQNVSALAKEVIAVIGKYSKLFQQIIAARDQLAAP